jgi:phospholipase C
MMTGRNIGDLLNAKKLTWGWFQGGFTPSSRTADGTAVCATSHKNINGATITDYVPHHAPFQFYPSTANKRHLPPLSSKNIGQTDQANHQYDLSDFFAAINAGVLPAVSYLKAAAYQDGHASNSNPLDEQTFIVNTVNAVMQSPFWSSTVVFILYDDSDGWYDHVMGPIVSASSVPEDNLSGPGSCGDGKNVLFQGRCGYGPRQPLLAISPFAKVNYVSHALSDQSSIIRFIEDNWNLGRIGEGSMDEIAGSLLDMFNFTGAPGKTLILDPATGTVVPPAPPKTPGTVTTAVANPKNAATSSPQLQLDGAASVSFDGKPLIFKWTLTPGSPNAAIAGDNTATPVVQFLGGAGRYTFTLTVTDSAGTTATDDTSVDVFFRPRG